MDRNNQALERSKPETVTASRSQHWLVNVRSGNGAGSGLLTALQGIDGVVVESIDFQNLEAQVRSIKPDDLIVVAGGDGTFSAVCGITHCEGRNIACLPLGTANDLAREFAIDLRLKDAHYRDYPALIRELPLRSCSVWTVEMDGRAVPCINYAALGYEGLVVRDFGAWRSQASRQRRLLNRVVYALYGLRHARYRLTNLHVENDRGAPFSCPPTTGLIVTNIQSHLGLGRSNSLSNPSDAVIECISVRTVFGFLRMLLASFGIGGGLPALVRGARISIKNIPPHTPVQIDGESYAPPERGEISVTFRHFVALASAR